VRQRIDVRAYYRAYYWANREHIRHRIRAKAAILRDQVEADFKHQRFGALTPLYPLVRTNKHHGGWWLCRCECGNEIEAWAYKLKQGALTSCGCRLNQLRRRRR